MILNCELMKNKWCLLSLLLLCACSSQGREVLERSESDGIESSTKIVSSYIRNNFLETGRVSAESMNSCNDLIIMGFNPYSDGGLYFEIPDNSASFKGNAEVLKELEGRKGVVLFKGAGEMLAGNDLLHTPAIQGNADAGKYSQFTFGAWLFVDQWVKGSCLFKKENEQGKIAFEEGETPGQFVLEVDKQRIILAAPGFQHKKWIHVALTYSAFPNNKGVHLYVNGKKVADSLSILSEKLPYIRTSMLIGDKARMALDEVFFNRLALSEEVINQIKNRGLDFSSWHMSKTLAYWKFDDGEKLGKDSHTWVDLLQRVKNEVTNPHTRIRAGISAGDWKTMCANEHYRNDFAQNVKKLIEKYDFDGVDLDFEWPLNSTEFDNYSQTIVKLREVIGRGKILTVSLHPLYYKISQEAIKAADHISLQCYGPSPQRFPYTTYVKEAQAAVEYGISKDKLVLGLPFYGAEEHKEGTVSYWDFVKSGLILNKEADEVVYKGKKYIFNGQNTIAQKTRYVIDESFAGVMSWDLATDVTLSHPLSLLKSVIDELN